MKMRATLSAIALAATVLHAQDQIVEIAPIVVTGTFELRREPKAVDSFTKYLERQIETKRTEQEAVDRSPIWNAFGRFIPIRLESSSDSRQFFTPNYLTPQYREAARQIEDFACTLSSTPDQRLRTRSGELPSQDASGTQLRFRTRQPNRLARPRSVY